MLGGGGVSPLFILCNRLCHSIVLPGCRTEKNELCVRSLGWLDIIRCIEIRSYDIFSCAVVCFGGGGGRRRWRWWQL